MNATNRYEIICNPKAGGGNSLIALAITRDIFTQAKADFEYILTTAPGHATRLASELYGKGRRNFVVIGGDGTIGEVLNGLPSLKDVNIGIIPGGTGNDFALPMGIPSDYSEAALTVLSCRAKPVDLMNANDIKVSCFATTGIDIAVVNYCNSLKKKRKNSYMHGTLKALFGYKADTYRITVDGKSFETKAAFVAVLNNGVLASGVKLCPPASCMDGVVDLLIMEDGGFWGNLKSFYFISKGKALLSPYVKHLTGKDITIAPTSLKIFDLDGELKEMEEMHVTAMPNALNVIR